MRRRSAVLNQFYSGTPGAPLIERYAACCDGGRHKKPGVALRDRVLQAPQSVPITGRPQAMARMTLKPKFSSS
jgi:hypothetical protein